MQEPNSQALTAPAVARNREPLLAALSPLLPEQGLVLELASGTGEHAAFFAARLPALTWQPSETDPRLLASIEAHRAAAGCANLKPPLALDVTAADWPLAEAAALLCVNMIHIAPWAAAEAVLAGAARLLPPGGPLVFYGPFKRDGRHTAQSNERFDLMLRAENPAWGVRDLEAVTALAAERGLAFETAVEMPANNLTVAYRRLPRRLLRKPGVLDQGHPSSSSG